MAVLDVLTASSPLRHIDAAAVSAAAKSESRNREVHLPPVSVYRWWARRTEAVNGAILNAVAAEHPSEDPLLVVDPFAGGGVIPLAARLRGHNVYAQDINPWAALGLTAMLGLPDPDAIRQGVAALAKRTTPVITAAYGTSLADGQPGMISHTFRVASAECPACATRQKLFPHAMLSLVQRKDRGGTDCLLACRNGHVTAGRYDRFGRCPACREAIDPQDSYTARRTRVCISCGSGHRLSELAASGTWRWDVVLVERTRDGGHRELAVPTPAEVRAAAETKWAPSQVLGAIPDGQETRVLRRHGFSDWADLYPARQRFVLEHLLEAVHDSSDDSAVRRLLRMAVIGSAEMAGHCSRWDRWYLKSFESMAGHRFNFTTLTVEPNAWGTSTSGRGTTLRRLDQLIKAATWMADNSATAVVCDPIPTSPKVTTVAGVVVAEGSSEEIALHDSTADLILTDPPYHDDVQYSELSLPLRAWAGLHQDSAAGEAVVNTATGHNSGDQYRDLLARIFRESSRVLKPDGHLIFSFANRQPTAWANLFQALQDAGLRAVGCQIVHSENERDQAKRDVRACSLDLLLDLIPLRGDIPAMQLRPQAPSSDEGAFLQVVARWFLRVGSLEDDWRLDFLREVGLTKFVA